MSKFSLSKKSESRLFGVHPDLVAVVRRAIEITEVDFSVGEGLRTIERQKELVAKGASQTMKSRHLTGMLLICMPLLIALCRGSGNTTPRFPSQYRRRQKSLAWMLNGVETGK